MLVSDEVVGLRDAEQAATRPAPTGLAAGATLDDAVRDLITTYHDLNPSTIDTLYSDPSPLEFMRYVARNRPFVIKNSAADWKARQHWTAAYLKRAMAGHSVNVSLTPHGNADSVVSLPGGGHVFAKPHEATEDFAAVIDAISAQGLQSTTETPAPRHIRYAQTQNDNLRDEYAPLLADVPPSIPFAHVALDRAPDAINLWLGSAASRTALHKDAYENLYAQILGRKHFVLLPPSDAACVGERGVLAGTYAPRDPEREGAGELVLKVDEPEAYVPCALWDPETPEVNATKYSSLARPIRVTLEEGDVMYLPALWYHQVRQSCDDEGLCCAVNYWYDIDFAGGFWSTAGFVRAVGVLGEEGGSG
ncbi:cupin-like domain-containing protein [Boeremia exigua]|uniref:cupin-like domain-containing protein n=1 Tax=Boeremia exigua TaxID=749465 RepID=UPI001E8DAC0E|nr:cupin-like domain-containing protein [Boeremia exigua]KAH6625470.1 cupin-like domain-containing protein [Boeremia exigua]